MYQVVVIEDDPMVAEIDRQYAERSPELHVAAIFSSGEAALSYFQEHSADLIVLDYYLPGLNGREFMERFRGAGHTADVIMVTAANESRNVTELSAFGLLDYLVKPFQFSRFQLAVDRFLDRKQILGEGGLQGQDALDRVFLSRQEDKGSPMEKGIQSVTMQRVRTYLTQHRGQPLTIEEISDGVGLSRVTVRRYMNHLVTAETVVGSVDYSTGGRPSSIYTYVG